jgi:hypothetical protein
MVCTPPYAIARGGIVLLGSRTWFALGVVLVVVGFTLQAGATGAVKAVKMSAKLVAGNPLSEDSAGEDPENESEGPASPRPDGQARSAATPPTD